MTDLREKIQRNKIIAEALFSEGKQAFIIDSKDEWFSCDILENRENTILFKPFKGNCMGQEVERYWVDIKIEEHK